MQTIIPDVMRAVVVDQQSKTLSVREFPIPLPGPGQVLVRMAAAPINPSDLGFANGSTAFRMLHMSFQALREVEQ